MLHTNFCSLFLIRSLALLKLPLFIASNSHFWLLYRKPHNRRKLNFTIAKMFIRFASDAGQIWSLACLSVVLRFNLKATWFKTQSSLQRSAFFQLLHPNCPGTLLHACYQCSSHSNRNSGDSIHCSICYLPFSAKISFHPQPNK